MIRPMLALAFIAAGLGVTFAQETPAAPAAPANVVVDPAAPIDTSSKKTNLLTGMYATQAVIELCNITLEEGVTNGMAADQKRLEASLAMDAPTAEKAYAVVKADVQKTEPDCAEGSSDRLGVDAVADIYKTSAPAAGQATAPAPAATAPAQ